ncbi:MAG: L-seryl-tRNA(Sec) selenium transferase [Bacillota bacterium]|nr:L-seryl-tRNA(Sec) selenium transferase [Bacillota bacterium]
MERRVQSGPRQIPSINELLSRPEVQALLDRWPRAAVVLALRDLTAELRSELQAAAAGGGKESEGGAAALRVLEDGAALSAELVRRLTARNLRRVINATGVVLHTNLGRAPLPREALAALEEVGLYYSNLEYDLEAGGRGSRHAHVEQLLCRLTGAEAALVVNNNAAAVLLCLDTLARGREVIVSRGELVEIGGSFRIPEVMARTGARLVEVGTTNKTYPRDYEEAITGETALLLKVHPSNFRVVGFTREVAREELVEIGHRHGLPVMEDLGSGVLVDLAPFGLPPEPTVQKSVAAGLDLVTFSGDKLLGGPQAGIIVGRADLVSRLARNPLARALRIDKLTLAALEATLRLYLTPELALQRIPTLALLAEPEDKVRARAEELARLLRAGGAEGLAEVEVVADPSEAGGGALPTAHLAGWAVALSPRKERVEEVERRLRAGSPPVVARIQQDRLFLHLRTVRAEELVPLQGAVLRALSLKAEGVG